MSDTGDGAGLAGMLLHQMTIQLLLKRGLVSSREVRDLLGEAAAQLEAMASHPGQAFRPRDARTQLLLLLEILERTSAEMKADPPERRTTPGSA